MNEARPTRAERRMRSEQRILDAARERFAENGYERTTIRMIASDAGIDPALVMQYFGSKEELFRKAITEPCDAPLTSDPRQLAELVLDTIGIKLGEAPGTSTAALRSMLTHPEAAENVRTSLARQLEQASAAISGDDADLRAALMLSTLLGVTVARDLLQLDALDRASPDEITALLRPCLRLLAEREAD